MKTLLAVVGALVIFGTGVYPQERADQSQLEQFAAFAEDEQLEVTSWTVTMKESIQQTKSEEWVTKASSFYKSEPILEKMANADKLTWQNKSGQVTETLSLIIPVDSNNSVERVYALNGKGTASLSQKVEERKNLAKSRLFSKNVTIFSCLKSEKNGIIDDVLMYEKFRDVFNVETINEVTDNGWTSWSGHSKKWGQSLPILNDEMNVQFASRILGGRTNVTIGTPIITAEY
ncbi:YwmB family TATA-box binding protein [Halobacillus litoralis]|uniref:YwmB family TATA-box binding protein n=1 Tax=Halobacillus litoralis TaxID=45668 RepID=UPI001CD540A8|nr:YwmB family TATA-box binding protein [Halobacillus litoralis]MCA0971014.1 YwmB family TATA-box binding protein [Halobacillus litoralis]